MTPAEQEKAVEYLSDGATLREAADMLGISWRDFSRCYLEGRNDAEGGIDSELASWYRDANAARARKRATLRAAASDAAGSRESTDLLAVLRALEEEEIPVEVDTGEGIRARSPLLVLGDRIAATEDPVERDRLKQIEREASEALHAAFHEAMRPAAV